MNKNLFFITFSVCILGCTVNNSNDSAPSISKNQDSDSTAKSILVSEKRVTVDTIQKSSWIDSLILGYIGNSKNEMLRSSLKNNLSIEWIFDQTIYSDTAVYFVYQIGHNFSDEDGINERFVTDQWLYIDSMTKEVFEYDIAKDSLLKWNK